MARNSLMPFRPGGLIGGDPFLSLHREMNRLFDDALRGSLSGSSDDDQLGQMRGVVNARMNVSETDKEIRITAELPGVAEKDIDVSLDDDVLTIRGEKRMEQKKDEKENFHFVERSFGSFQRSLRLPYSIDPEQVQARFENGVLTVTLPKTAQAERSRRIQVQGGARQGTSSNGGSGAGAENAQGGQSGAPGHDGGGKQPGASPGI